MASGTIKTSSGQLSVQNISFGSKTLAHGTAEVYQVSCARDGYRPLGVVAVRMDNTTIIVPYYFGLWGNDVMIKCRNTYGSGSVTFTPSVDVLYEKL